MTIDHTDNIMKMTAYLRLLHIVALICLGNILLGTWREEGTTLRVDLLAIITMLLFLEESMIVEAMLRSHIEEVAAMGIMTGEEEATLSTADAETLNFWLIESGRFCDVLDL